ncbi:glycosyltransferase family 2 protein [Flavobacterium agricola]|uniref:Glycosyltransferase family 2 protein n=1 Tax=Flavobacterium agricola TaxID=2870839 RepID=A0ABY6M212_9FLAO|nr:glycosyltransferase family A protein [Flavobacterium agricola]UYW02576.1 glycosyltransferase family 2 protein [Flavobacterium agricola]
MKYYVVIPAYNEQAYLNQTLNSLVNQTVLPTKVVVVNDNSTDETANIVLAFAEQYPFIELVNKQSKAVHLPGSKVIQAFNAGFATLDANYDVIVKLDADLILPETYFETILNYFKADAQLGMAGGVALIEKNNAWVVEKLTDMDHIRGAFKAYRKEAFIQIGGLQPAMGWDTVDELLCRYYHWKIKVDTNLQIKHLKPTGAVYDASARYKQGEAFYVLGYGFSLTAIASVKLAVKKGKPLLALDYIKGFFKAKKAGKTKLVSPKQEKFVRQFRWQKIKHKVLG